MSTIRVNNLQNTSTTDGGISIDTSGHVTVDGVAMPSAGPLSNRNLVINGAMQVAQRGTSSTTNGFGTVDRFNNGYNSGTVTQSQESLTSGSPYDEGFRNFLRFTNTTASSDNAAGYRMARYNIEAQDLASSGWNYTSSSSYLTLSFWIRASVSQAYYVYIKTHDGTAQRYVFSTGTLTADTWTKVTHQIPGNSNLTINNDNGAGLELNFSAFWGTDYTDSGVTVDTWGTYAGTTRTPDMTTTWSTTTNATFDLTGVQLEVGSVATPFEHRSYGDELARCLRYYWSQGTDSTYGFFALLATYFTTTNIRGGVDFPVPMRTFPGLSISAAGDFQNLGGSTLSDIELADGGTSGYHAGIRATLTTNQTHPSTSILRANNTTNATLKWDAEL